MSFTPYPVYKTAYAEWLEKIPAHWQLTPLKHSVRFSGGGTPDKQNLDYWDGDIPWVSPKDMRLEVIRDTQDKITETAVDNSAADWILEGAVLLVFRSGILCRTIPVALAGTELCLNQDMKALVGFPDPAFLLRLIQAHTAGLLPIWRQQGATVESLDYEQVANTKIPCPPAEERQRIIKFLEHETAKIDALVGEQKRLIKLLKEKRQAVISHAVTKGLDPTVPLKDTGVERLGTIPQHWRTARFKVLAKIRNGRDYKSVETENSGYPVIGSGGAFAFANNYLHKGPSVLLGRKGTVDKPLLVREPFWTVDTMFYTEIERSADPAYLYYSAMTFEYDALSTNTALPSMAQEDLANVFLAAPQRVEQERIAAFLDHKTAKIDALVADQKHLVELLQERRTALISAAVTGKIDVRGWQPPADEYAAEQPTQSVEATA